MTPSNIERDVQIVNRLGLHARAAAKFVRLASEFNAMIFVARDGFEVNGKSIMGVMMLAASRGSTIRLRAVDVDESNDAAAAIDALAALIQNRFEESE
ncbi:MAG: HPr family phosphocarrier protein [Thioalkalivibrionaceae bacterium]